MAAFSEIRLWAIDAGQAQLYYRDGMRALQEKDVDQAESMIKQAANLDPMNYLYPFELSNIYALRYDNVKSSPRGTLAKDMLTAAIQSLEQTVMLNPDFVPAQFNLGVMYKNRGEFEKARDHFREVLRLRPKEIKAFLQIGETYERQGFFDDARDWYKKAKDIDFGSQEVQDAIAESYRNEQTFEQGRKNRDNMETIAKNRSPFNPQMGASSLLGNLRQNAEDPSTNAKSGLGQLAMLAVRQFMKSRDSSQ